MKFENTEVWGFEHSLRGMRKPLNSHIKSDSYYEMIIMLSVKMILDLHRD